MKRVQLGYDAISDELAIKGKSKAWLSAEIGRSRSYFANLPGTRHGAVVPENVESLISRTLGYEPGTFVLPEEENDEHMQAEFIETLYGNQKDILKVLGELSGKIDMLMSSMKNVQTEAAARKRHEELSDSVEFIRGKSNTIVIKLEKLKEILVEMDNGKLDDRDKIIDEIAKMLENRTVITKDSARGKAYELLEELVTDRSGVEQARVYEEADKRNISRKDILRAKNEMDIRVATRGIGAGSKKYWCRY
nr:MAG TPA: hypothetical protein [Caudoviricetes sp.]